MSELINTLLSDGEDADIAQIIEHMCKEKGFRNLGKRMNHIESETSFDFDFTESKRPKV
jgi:regulator of RNase E activity RraB